MRWPEASKTPNAPSLNSLEQATWTVKSFDGFRRLEAIADIFEIFGLGTWNWKGRSNGYVATNYPNNVLHEQVFQGTTIGRAFDGYISPNPPTPGYQALASVPGNTQDRLDCALYIKHHLTPYLTEAIFNSGLEGKNLSVKNGQSVSSSAWTEGAWEFHSSYIHIAV